MSLALSSAEIEPASAWRVLPKLAREVWFCHFWNIHWGLKPTGVDEWDWVAAVTFISFQTFDINYSPEYWTCLHFLARWRAIWLGQSVNMCSVAIWHKKTSFNCYSWHSSSRAGGLALMHSLSVVPLPTLLRLPRNCASLCPTSVVSIYRLLSASTEKVCVHCSPSNKGAESSSWPISQKLTPNNVVVATSQNWPDLNALRRVWIFAN